MLTAVPLPDDQDGINFLLGVENYDLLLHQPHFPGYPVYIGIAKLVRPLFISTEWTLVFVSTFSGAVSIALFFIIARSFLNDKKALLCALMFALNPVFFAFSQKLFTEAFALCLLLAVFAVLQNKKSWLLAGFLTGILLGIRVSWWPFAAVFCLYALWNNRIFFVGLILGIAIWLIPQLSYVGWLSFIQIGSTFTSGHFTLWGSSFVRGETQNLLLFIALLSISGILLYQNKKLLDQHTQMLVLATGVYIIWVLFAQNLEKIRHFIPVLPVLSLLFIPLIKKQEKMMIFVIGILFFSTLLPYVTRQINTPPAKQLHHWLQSLNSSEVILYCGQTERFFDRYSSRVTVKSVNNFDTLMQNKMTSWWTHREQFACNDIPGFRSNKKAIAVFQARPGDPVDKTLRVYALN